VAAVGLADKVRVAVDQARQQRVPGQVDGVRVGEGRVRRQHIGDPAVLDHDGAVRVQVARDDVENMLRLHHDAAVGHRDRLPSY
jgi:hypothetical protein